MKNKVCVIKGGGGMLGKQYAKTITDAGGIAISLDNWGESDLMVDVTKEIEVEKAIKQILKLYGKIDVLINNAAMNPVLGGTRQFVPIEDYVIGLWRKEIDVNLTGMFICSKAVVPIMKKQGGGVIINIASEVSEIAHDHRVYNEPNKYKSPAYVASKTGVVGLTRALAAQLGQYNIRVNALSPGGVESSDMPRDFVNRLGKTNMLSRMAKPDEFNNAILFLCSSTFMTGHNLVIDGGKSAW